MNYPIYVQDSDISILLRNGKQLFTELCSLSTPEYRKAQFNQPPRMPTSELRNGVRSEHTNGEYVSRYKFISDGWIISFSVFDYEGMGLIDLPHQIILNGSGFYRTTNTNGKVLFEHNSPDDHFTLDISISEEEYFQKSLLYSIPDRDMIMDVIDAGLQIDTKYGFHFRICPIKSIPRNINLHLQDMINFLNTLR